jgi:hypothetical protein
LWRKTSFKNQSSSKWISIADDNHSVQKNSQLVAKLFEAADGIGNSEKQKNKIVKSIFLNSKLASQFSAVSKNKK